MADLSGTDYRARVRVSDGEDRTLADVGETCERVNPGSLVWLLAQGHIERAAPPLVERAVDASGVETRGDV